MPAAWHFPGRPGPGRRPRRHDRPDLGCDRCSQEVEQVSYSIGLSSLFRKGAAMISSVLLSGAVILGVLAGDGAPTNRRNWTLQVSRGRGRS